MKRPSTIGNQKSTIHKSAPVRVLIAEDSLTVREYLRYSIDSRPDMQVVAVARDGEEAVRMVQMHHPDVVSMDIHMPVMDGLKATERIMAEYPVPIVIVTSSWYSDRDNLFRAMRAGALTLLKKPPGPGHPDSAGLMAKVIDTLKVMSEVKVVRRFHKPAGSPIHEAAHPKGPVAYSPPQGVKMVAIGSSTGGPPVLKTIFQLLSSDFPLPILAVQHITAGFLEGMVDWLNKECPLSVRIPRDGEWVQAGNVYFAPDNHHMGIREGGLIFLNTDPPESGLRPSVSSLFRSAARSYGSRAVGVLLTGMGKDGAQELKEMKDAGAVTLVQDKESCAVFGMPGEAVKIGGASHILAPEEIAAWLNALAETINGKRIGE